MAEKVNVVRVGPGDRGEIADQQLIEHLELHGIHPLLSMRRASRSTAAEIIACAEEVGASYILMGAYGHSRAGEFIVGGVTRALLRECPVSLIVAH